MQGRVVPWYSKHANTSPPSPAEAVLAAAGTAFPTAVDEDNDTIAVAAVTLRLLLLLFSLLLLLLLLLLLVMLPEAGKS